MQPSKRAIKEVVKEIVELADMADWLMFARGFDDEKGRMFVCAGCGQILPLKHLKSYEYFGDRGVSHCCRNLTTSSGPPAWFRTSWKRLTGKWDQLKMLRDYLKFRRDTKPTEVVAEDVE